MNLALVIPELHKTGGTERCMSSLAEALARRGHRFTIFSSQRDPAVLPSSRSFRVPMIRRPLGLRFFSFLVAQRIRRGFVGSRFDLVISTGPDVLKPDVTILHCCAGSFAKLSKEGNQHASGSLVSALKRWNGRLGYAAIAAVERYVARAGARRVIAISNSLKSEIVEQYGSVAVRAHVLPDGVDAAEFRPCTAEMRLAARQKLSLSPEDNVVLFVGHNWHRKGLPALAEAIRTLKNNWTSVPCTVLIAGDGDEETRQRITSLLHDRVRFLGREPDMARVYAAADMLVLPTLSEPFGLPVLEAMACGLPVIVSRIAGVSELLTDGVDALFIQNPRDVNEIAARIRKLLACPDCRVRMGLAARMTAEKYTWDTLAERFEAICADLLQERVR